MTNYLSFKELQKYNYNYSEVSKENIELYIAIAKKFNPDNLKNSIKKIFKEFIEKENISFIDEVTQEDICNLNPISKAVVLKSIDKSIYKQIENTSMHYAALALTGSLKNSFTKLSNLEYGQIETMIENPVLYKNLIGSQMANYLKNSHIDSESLLEYIKYNSRELNYDIKNPSHRDQIKKLYDCDETGLIITIFSFFHEEDIIDLKETVVRYVLEKILENDGISSISNPNYCNYLTEDIPGKMSNSTYVQPIYDEHEISLMGA